MQPNSEAQQPLTRRCHVSRSEPSICPPRVSRRRTPPAAFANPEEASRRHFSPSHVAICTESWVPWCHFRLHLASHEEAQLAQRSHASTPQGPRSPLARPNWATRLTCCQPASPLARLMLTAEPLQRWHVSWRRKKRQSRRDTCPLDARKNCHFPTTLYTIPNAISPYFAL